MKRIGNLHSQIADIDNIEYADEKARKNKGKNWGVFKHDKHKREDNLKLLMALKDLTYVTSPYSNFIIYEPKERLIFRLPYYPDRIVHHSIMNIMEPIWIKIFIDQSYSCIKGRGIHKLAKDIMRALKDKEGTMYCLKLDITKFYPSVDHAILKEIIRKKVKDKKLLVLLDGIIDSADGVPIGNYLSQFFANLYLTYFDHWLKEEVGVKYYFRYADDIVILSDSKEFLHKVMILIKLYLKAVLNLKVKPNYQIFPVDSRGIDFVGYRFYHTHTLLRKSIKKNLLKLIERYKKGLITKEDLKRRLSSYFGWLKYCNSKNLLRLVEAQTGIHYSNWNGKESKTSNFYEKYIYIIEKVDYEKYFKIHFIYRGKSHSVNSRSKGLQQELNKQHYPLIYKLHKNGSKKNHFKSAA